MAACVLRSLPRREEFSVALKDALDTGKPMVDSEPVW